MLLSPYLELLEIINSFPIHVAGIESYVAPNFVYHGRMAASYKACQPQRLSDVFGDHDIYLRPAVDDLYAG